MVPVFLLQILQIGVLERPDFFVDSFHSLAGRFRRLRTPPSTALPQAVPPAPPRPPRARQGPAKGSSSLRQGVVPFVDRLAAGRFRRLSTPPTLREHHLISVRTMSPASTTSVRQRQLDLCSLLLSSRRRGRWAVENAQRFPRGVGGCRVVGGGGSLPYPVRPPAGVVGVRGRRGSFPQPRLAHDVLALSVRLLAASAR